MKIFFANLSSLIFDVTTPEHQPLGGSESSLCYLARQMAKKGHDVTLAARVPDNCAEVVAGVRHQPIAVMRDKAYFDANNFDVVITVNAAVACPRLREFSPQSINILWDHLPPDQEAVKMLANPILRESIDCIVYVSAWQKSETEREFKMTAPHRIIANGITPSFENMFSSKEEVLEAKKNRAAYTSVPDRGLAELLDAMEGLPADTGLIAFSSMRVYQTDDDAHEKLFSRAKEDARVALYGSVSQTELAARLKSAAFLTYPCIRPETFCLAALEGLAAGMKVITTDIGGIRSTTMGFADVLPFRATDSREQFIQRYRQLIEKNIEAFKANPEAWAERMFEQVRAVNRQCTWAQRAREWEDLLVTMKRQKSAVETQRPTG